MAEQYINIPHNQLQLSGVLHLPESKHTTTFPLIILLHGFVGSKVGEHRLFVKAARHFTSLGYGVFRFDFSGCGESDGDYGNVTVTNQLQEVQTVIDYVSQLEQVDASNITLIGHSLGGAIASLTAAKDARIKKLILWSPVGQPYEDISQITGEHAVTFAEEYGKFDYHGFYLSNDFFNDLKNHQPMEAIRSYSNPALVIHAEADEDIPKEHTTHYYQTLVQRENHAPVQTYFIAHADHTFSSYSFENNLFNLSSEWLHKLHDASQKIA